jgi:hypothetical protein
MFAPLVADLLYVSDNSTLLLAKTYNRMAVAPVNSSQFAIQIRRSPSALLSLFPLNLRYLAHLYSTRLPLHSLNAALLLE